MHLVSFLSLRITLLWSVLSPTQSLSRTSVVSLLGWLWFGHDIYKFKSVKYSLMCLFQFCFNELLLYPIIACILLRSQRDRFELGEEMLAVQKDQSCFFTPLTCILVLLFAWLIQQELFMSSFGYKSLCLTWYLNNHSFNSAVISYPSSCHSRRLVIEYLVRWFILLYLPHMAVYTYM